MNVRTPLKCFCLVGSALFSVHAFAAIYKCTDNAGNISYVQNPTNANCVLIDGSSATTDTTIVAPTVVYPATVRDPGVNQPGAAGNVGGARVDPGVNQPGAAGNVGRDPGINQPGAAGNVGGAGVDPGYNPPGAAGNVGRDPGVNQPGAAGNRRRR